MQQSITLDQLNEIVAGRSIGGAIRASTSYYRHHRRHGHRRY